MSQLCSRMRAAARRRSARATAALAVCALALAGCGGGGDSEEVKRTLERAFAAPIESARVTLDVELAVEGIDELDDPIRLKLSGPYRPGGPRRIPAFDWDFALSGGGQSLNAGFLSTGDNVFVEFQGTAYELGEAVVARFNRQLAEAERADDDRGLRQFGVDPTDWLSDAREEGDEEVAGAQTTHLSAKVDVGRMLDDLNELVDRARARVPGGPPPARLTEEQQREIERVVREPRFDVYVGKRDGRVRRLSADLRFEVPEESRQRVGGLEGGTLSLSIEFAGIGEPQRIEAPARARPIAELTARLGGLDALRGGVGPDDATPPPTGGSGGGGQRQSGLEAYSRCLEEADPSRVDEIERCSELLR